MCEFDYFRPRTILFSGALCAYCILNFVYWVHDKYMTITALLHCIGSILIIIGTLTLFVLYLPHISSHITLTSKPRKTGAIMILIGGILHFIASILAISNPLYCNFTLCEIHIFVFMILPVSLTLILFLDEFYLIFYKSLRLRITIYSFVLFLTSILFLPYYATARAVISELMDILYQIIWIIILINTSILMICIGCKHKHNYKHKHIKTSSSNTWSERSWNRSRSRIDSKILAESNCCPLHESTRKSIILITALILMVIGTSTLIAVYFYSNYDQYDLILSYYVLVIVTTWIIGSDTIMYYRNIEYEPIIKKQTKQSQYQTKGMDINENSFDDDMNNNYDDDMDDDHDMDDNNNAWNDEIEFNDDSFNRHGSAYD